MASELVLLLVSSFVVANSLQELIGKHISPKLLCTTISQCRATEMWWKPNAPHRQICLQDLMNEVFRSRWAPLPEAFNFQGYKVRGGRLPVCQAGRNELSA